MGQLTTARSASSQFRESSYWIPSARDSIVSHPGKRSGECDRNVTMGNDTHLDRLEERLQMQPSHAESRQ